MVPLYVSSRAAEERSPRGRSTGKIRTIAGKGSLMGSIIYVAKVSIEPDGLLQRAVLPGGASITFDEYRPIPKRSSSAGSDQPPEPLDYLVATVGASLTGSFVSGLATRGVALEQHDLTVEVQGDVERDASEVAILKRIHVRYRLHVPSYRREVVERVLAIHTDVCPIARTLKGCVAIGTVVEYR